MSSAWFETFFQGPAVELWNRLMPPALTVAEADFVEKTLGVERGARLLDVPCGNGRHAIELARRGHKVTAVDLSREFLSTGERAAEEAGVDIDWRHGDMRALALDASAYDGAYCFGNSFGYLNVDEARAFLSAISCALRPGGRLAIDTGVCAESLHGQLPPKRWHRAGDIFMLSECRYVAEASRLDIDYTFIQGGVVETRPTSSYVVTAAELQRMLNGAGLQVVGMVGGSGEPFKVGSPLVITSEKRE